MSMCTKCGKEPVEVDGLCQMCWEAWCSEQWWATEGGMTCPLAVAAWRRNMAQAKLEAILNSKGIANGTADSS